MLHNDQSGGVILPSGSYTVSSPNLGCQTASNYFTTFLNKYNYAIPGWKGVEIAKGWGTYIKNGSSTQFTVKWSKAKRGTTSACATSALKVSLGPANGAAGTVFYPLNFVNTGKLGCTLRGYPGVSAVTSSGKQIGSPASQISSSYKTVTLLPGKSAERAGRDRRDGQLLPVAVRAGHSRRTEGVPARSEQGGNDQEDLLDLLEHDRDLIDGQAGQLAGASGCARLAVAHTQAPAPG